MVNVMQAVILVPVALILFSALGVVSFDLIFDANTSNWDTATVTMWELLPMISVIVIIIAFLVLVGLKFTGKL